MSSYNSIRGSTTAQITTVSDKYMLLQNGQGIYSYKNSNFSSNDDKDVITSISASTAVPQFLTGSQVDFRIENQAIDILNFPVLQASFLNNSGANASMAGLHLMIQRLDVISEGNTIWTTNDQELFLSNMFLDKNTQEAIFTADLGLNNNFSQAAPVIAAAGTYEILMPIWGLFKSLKLFVPGLNGALTLRFYFNPNSFYIITGAEMVCQSLNLLLYGKKLKAEARNAALKVYRDVRVPLSLSHLSVDRTSQTMNLTANQSVKLVLNGISGVCAFILMTIRTSATASVPNGGSTTYNYVQNLDIVDQSNVSLIGSYQRDYKARNLLTGIKIGNTNVQTLNVDMVPFCTDPVSAYGAGICTGYAIMTGTESILFTTTSTLASASYIIDIRAYNYQNAIIKNGKISTSKA